jgi:hypothetical protein
MINVYIKGLKKVCRFMWCRRPPPGTAPPVHLGLFDVPVDMAEDFNACHPTLASSVLLQLHVGKALLRDAWYGTIGPLGDLLEGTFVVLATCFQERANRCKNAALKDTRDSCESSKAAFH